MKVTYWVFPLQCYHNGDVILMVHGGRDKDKDIDTEGTLCLEQ